MCALETRSRQHEIHLARGAVSRYSTKLAASVQTPAAISLCLPYLGTGTGTKQKQKLSVTVFSQGSEASLIQNGPVEQG